MIVDLFFSSVDCFPRDFSKNWSCKSFLTSRKQFCEVTIRIKKTWLNSLIVHLSYLQLISWTDSRELFLNGRNNVPDTSARTEENKFISRISDAENITYESGYLCNIVPKGCVIKLLPCSPQNLNQRTEISAATDHAKRWVSSHFNRNLA